MTSTSSILAGERRWVSARRGGMTVLGKVAAPKPLNLPSQRLENHGLDPNVEIVPKGTLSWGGRSSSAASNPWGSSTLSPNVDSSTGSSSHLRARPSSGGSGTRPSTAGSDKLHEPAANAWGPNSRPSSASGALTSSQASSTSLRPHSAETKPGSSHLSRFAEPSSEISGAWGATSTAEKLGVLSSKNDGFSLSSGDFPTLGLGRENSGKNIESQDYGSRPSSSSGRAGSAKERSSTSQDDVKSIASNSWRRDDHAHVEDGVHSSADKWQGDPQLYVNANVPPQHFDAWHGPPMNAPPGVWYRGPPTGPPYVAPVAPGGFPMEPFPYYRPQIPPALANSQPVPPLGPGPRGHHPKNGDLFRPQIPDAFIRPNVPTRPGFYPGPVPYEGFYGPPMGYCNSSEREIPFMGMPTGPQVYNRYPAPNGPDPGNNHARAGGRGSMGKTRASEQSESGHFDGNRAPHKVLMRHHNDWDGNEADNWEHSLPADASSLEKLNQPRTTLRKFEWGADDERDNETPVRKTTAGEKSLARTFDNRGGCMSESMRVESPERMGISKEVGNSWALRSEMESAAFDEAPQPLTSTSRDSTLIQKIEGLNAKARASDGWHDIVPAPSREEQNNRLHAHNVKAISPATEDGHATGNSGPAPCVSSGDGIVHPPAACEIPVSRKAYHGGQGRGEHHGKGRYHSQDADGWRKKSPAAESSGAVAASSELSSIHHSHDGHAPVEVLGKSDVGLEGKDEMESSMPMLDHSDSQAQRAKMRELAKQRAIQLQKEEEERTREQKAKALAKLEELNRRTQAGDGFGRKVEEISPSSAMKQEKEELPMLAGPLVDATKDEAPSSTLVSACNSVAQINEITATDGGESNVLSGDTFMEMPKNTEREPLLPHGQSVSLKQDVCSGDAADCDAAPQINDISAPRQKRMSYRQKHSVPLDKDPIECQVHSTEPAKNHRDVSYDIASAEVAARRVGSNGESSLPSNSITMADSSLHQRRRNNRSGKNKHKMEEASVIGSLPSTETKESHPGKPLTEHAKSTDTKLELDGGSIQSVADSKDTIQSSEQRSSLLSEEAHGRVNNQWKSQHSRRMPRNAQGNRLADKGFGNDAVIWAPVRSQNRVEAADEGSQITVPRVVAPTGKSDNVVQNNMKNKRAEMERYVPKPVAKEMAQQGSSQQSVASSFNQTTSDEAAGKADSESSQPAAPVARNVGCSIELKNTDGKPNKQPLSHGAWRQRGLTESSQMQGLPHAPSSSHPSKGVEKSLGQDNSMRPNMDMPESQEKCSDEGNTSDGWNMPESYEVAAPVIPPAIKDQGLTGKGKKHPFKGGQRNKGSNNELDHNNANIGEIGKSHIQSVPVENSQTDIIASKEDRGPVERASSWQPKSHPYSGNNQRGGRFNRGQYRSSETGRGIQNGSLSQGRVDFQSEPDKESSETIMTHPRQGPSVSENKHLAGKISTGHPDARREWKAAPSRGRPYSPNQGPLNADGSSHAGSTDVSGDQSFSGVCKNGNQNNRSGQVHDSNADWSSSGQGYRQQNTPAYRERQRHNSHYEYQPVGPHNSSKFNHLEGSTDGLQNTGSRYREKGQGHSRRGVGNSYGRQSGSARVDADHGWAGN